MKNFQTIAFVLFAALPYCLKAQVSIGSELSAAIGLYSQNAYLCLGGAVLMEFPVKPNLAIVGHVGYTKWSLQDEFELDRQLSTVSMQVGLRYNITRQFYMQGFAGPHAAFSTIKIYGKPLNSQAQAFGWAIGPGYLPGKNFTMSARLQFMDKLAFLVFSTALRFGNMKNKK